MEAVKIDSGPGGGDIPVAAVEAVIEVGDVVVMSLTEWSCCIVVV